MKREVLKAPSVQSRTVCVPTVTLLVVVEFQPSWILQLNGIRSLVTLSWVCLFHFSSSWCISIWFVLILSPHIHVHNPSGLLKFSAEWFLRMLSRRRVLNVLAILSHFNSVTQTKEYWLWSSLLCDFPSYPVHLWSECSARACLFSNIKFQCSVTTCAALLIKMDLCFSWKMRDQVLHMKHFHNMSDVQYNSRIYNRTGLRNFRFIAGPTYIKSKVTHGEIMVLLDWNVELLPQARNCFAWSTCY